ncbi:hypothetical protein AVEN_207657-1 [Araneus ventricosus]|uniref:Uncharacterized protein n=1 Tax=Araneus ventricosus TaxID=182803 RepID=A0A4Y2KU74_ARAVE|nr:hypothetical protein AVEN_207657-1 [Araneus ventricosus]
MGQHILCHRSVRMLPSRMDYLLAHNVLFVSGPPHIGSLEKEKGGLDVNGKACDKWFRARFHRIFAVYVGTLYLPSLVKHSFVGVAQVLFLSSGHSSK